MMIITVAGADGLLIATPEPNGPVLGVPRTTIDWAPCPQGAQRPRGQARQADQCQPRPYGAAWALGGLHKILSVAGAEVTEAGLAVRRVPSQFTPAGPLASPALRCPLTRVLDELMVRAAGLPPGKPPDHTRPRRGTCAVHRMPGFQEDRMIMYKPGPKRWRAARAVGRAAAAYQANRKTLEPAIRLAADLLALAALASPASPRGGACR